MCFNTHFDKRRCCQCCSPFEHYPHLSDDHLRGCCLSSCRPCPACGSNHSRLGAFFSTHPSSLSTRNYRSCLNTHP